MRARELRIEAHVERCVEIGGCVAGQAWAHAAKQAIQLGASKGGAGGRGLKCTLGEVIDGEGGSEDCKHLRLPRHAHLRCRGTQMLQGSSLLQET